MSKLLLDEHPLQVLPKLAYRIGLNEALILQQIHYWNEINKRSNNNYKDGHHWTFNSITQWQEQFPFWSKNTIQRTITNLEKMKLIVTSNYNKLKIDRTKWYRIDYNVLSALERSPLHQIGVTKIPKWCEHLTNLGLPLPEINSEINSKINNIYLISQNEDHLFKYYELKYKKHTNLNHPTMNEDKMKELKSNYDEINCDLDLNDNKWESLVDRHFDNLPYHNDGNILAFLSPNGGQGCVRRYIEDFYNEGLY